MWQRGRGRGRKQGQWPGQGPFSHLPPWERPGWRYGPGSCWTFYRQNIPPINTNAPKTSYSTPLFCKECGASLLPNSQYCHNCGKKCE